MGSEGDGVLQRSRGALGLSSETGPDGCMIRLWGELDLAAADLLDEEVLRAGTGHTGKIVIDLSGLEFIDAAGIHMLIDLESASQSNGSRLRVIPASGPVQRLLELTGADRQLSYLI